MGGGIGGFEVDVFDREQAGFVQDAVRLLPDSDSGLRAAVLARLSIASAATASADQRASLAEQAAVMARRVGDTEAEVAALAAFCDARSGPAYVRERMEAAGRMLALADQHGPAANAEHVEDLARDDVVARPEETDEHGGDHQRRGDEAEGRELVACADPEGERQQRNEDERRDDTPEAGTTLAARAASSQT